MSVPRLELRHVTKRYGDVVANDDVALSVAPGEIHAVLGENGAGKSTLMKVVYGAVAPDAGEILWDGRPAEVRTPHDARALGIAMVFQHFSLFDSLTVAENVWLGLSRKVALRDVTERIRAKAAEYGLDVDPLRPVHVLSVGERQRVEIVRALLADPRLLILDEPTAVLTPQAVDKLFETLRQVAANGCSILYISHKLDEILELCHACTVLRGGRVVATCDPTRESTASLSRMMIGAEPPRLERREAKLGPVALSVERLALPCHDRFGVALDDVSLEVHGGEIVGIAGVSGNGQQELLAALSGEDPRAEAGAIRLFGEPIGRTGAAGRRRRGLHFVPEERLGRGAVPSLSLATNMLLTRQEALRAFGWIDRAALRDQASGVLRRYWVKAAGPGAVARSLSGGNLQKYIVGRELDAVPKVLVVAQPTWGVDVGAAAQIHAELLRLRDAGAAVLVVSEELEELFALADRLHVIAKGRLSPPLPAADATVERIGEWMSGLWAGGPGRPEAAAGGPA
ncbi:ABC transporter-related protein [Anaeromyxobacter sp. K]|uniref:ABC transporter ATP-binding protein n=1 Tax=Anaeromyxobacter sp. (strain K) TaxID=447217 RepID=UPI00015F8CB9|nr:ABC transporter ATP-binding protein [Anaeromyxobacter sp. K]ACG72298.1 ABC transporter-related protein [Anaeromyxobacter sp. K]